MASLRRKAREVWQPSQVNTTDSAPNSGAERTGSIRSQEASNPAKAKATKMGCQRGVPGCGWDIIAS